MALAPSSLMRFCSSPRASRTRDSAVATSSVAAGVWKSRILSFGFMVCVKVAGVSSIDGSLHACLCQSWADEGFDRFEFFGNLGGDFLWGHLGCDKEIVTLGDSDAGRLQKLGQKRFARRLRA